MWWSKHEATVVNERLAAIESELVKVRQMLEDSECERVVSNALTLGVKVFNQQLAAEFVRLHAKLDEMKPQPPRPEPTTQEPLRAFASLFEELPRDDPRGLTQEERLLTAAYKEQE